MCVCVLGACTQETTHWEAGREAACLADGRLSARQQQKALVAVRQWGGELDNWPPAAIYTAVHQQTHSANINGLIQTLNLIHKNLILQPAVEDQS